MVQTPYGAYRGYDAPSDSQDPASYYEGASLPTAVQDLSADPSVRRTSLWPPLRPTAKAKAMRKARSRGCSRSRINGEAEFGQMVRPRRRFDRRRHVRCRRIHERRLQDRRRRSRPRVREQRERALERPPAGKPVGCARLCEGEPGKLVLPRARHRPLRRLQRGSFFRARYAGLGDGLYLEPRLVQRGLEVASDVRFSQHAVRRRPYRSESQRRGDEGRAARPCRRRRFRRRGRRSGAGRQGRLRQAHLGGDGRICRATRAVRAHLEHRGR